MRPRLLSSLALLSALGLAAPARAQGGPAVPASADEIHTLEVEIDRDVVTLASGSCAVACQALASMRHAAERICALDPGTRCEGARAKVKDAARRVQEACGECRPLGGESPPPVVSSEKPEVIRKERSLDQPPPPPAPPPPASPPAQPAEDVSEVEVVRARRGGCAGCVVGGDEGAAGAGLLAALGAIAAGARRRRRRG